MQNFNFLLGLLALGVATLLYTTCMELSGTTIGILLVYPLLKPQFNYIDITFIRNHILTCIQFGGQIDIKIPFGLVLN